DKELRVALDRAALGDGSGPVPSGVTTVSGRNVTLLATGSIGKTAGTVTILMSDLTDPNVTLTDEQVGAITTAVAPGSITINAYLNGSSTLTSFNLTHQPSDCSEPIHTLPCNTINVYSISIAENAPLFVHSSAGGSLAVNAGGSAFVVATGSTDVALAQFWAGGNGSLTAPQNITGTGATTPTIKTGGDMTITASAGDLVGPSSGPLVIRIGGILRAATAGGNISLRQDLGNLTQTGNVTGIIAGGNITLTSSGTVGNGQAVIGQTNDSSTVTITAGSNINYDAVDNLHVNSVSSTSGDVTLAADSSIFDRDLSNGSADISGNSVTLVANLGGLGWFDTVGNVLHALNVNSHVNGVGTLSAAATQDIYIIEASGDMVLGTVGTPATVYLQANNGNITNGLASGTNITSITNAWLSAALGIGTGAKSVTTSVSHLVAHAGGGSMFIDNAGALTVGGVLTNTHTTPVYGLDATGAITLTVHSPLTIAANVHAGGNILFQTADDSASDGITVNPSIDITSTGGSVELDAGDNITTSTTSSINAATTATFRGDFGNTDAAGTTITLQGSLTAPTSFVYGNSNNDTIILRFSALSSHVEVFGGNGVDTIWVDGLPNLDVSHTCTTNPCGDPSTLNTGSNLNRQTVDLDGQGGGDNYIVQTTGNTSYIVNIHDSGAPNDGVDNLTVYGTSADDTFLLRAQFVSKLDAGSVVERINYDSSINTLQVDGWAENTAADAPDGNDSFYVDDNSALTVLDGGTGDDTFQFGQMFGADRQPPDVAPGDQIATVDTTVGWLSRGISYSTVAYGGDGEDTFTVYSNKATLKLFGEDGDDTFIVRAFIIIDPVTLISTNTVATTDTILNTGAGNDHIEYNVNAPVSIDGGAGTDTVVVVGTEQADNFVVTKNGIMGAGLNVTYTNVERVELDGLEGDDHFYILSTNPDVITTIVGGLGSDTVDVGGDVLGQVVALSTEGVSGYINHTVVSADPAYNGIFVDGVQLNVATGNAGEVVLDTSASADQIIENGGGGTDRSSYTLKLAVPPAAGSVAYVTVSATGDSNKYGQAGGGSILLSTDGVNFSQSLILTFDNRGPPNPSTDPNRTVTIYYKAVSDGVQEGPQTVIIQSSISSTDPTIDRAEISNVEVKVVDDDKPGLIIGQSEGTTSIIEGSQTNGQDTYTVRLTKAPSIGETVTVTLAVNDPKVLLPSYTLTFDSSDWNVDQTITVWKNDDGIPQNEVFRTITATIATSGGTGTYTPAIGQDGANNVTVDVNDADVGSVVIYQTGGTTKVAPGVPDYYFMRLSQAPTANVDVYILTDGKTLVGGPNVHFDGQGKPYVEFTTTNWFLYQYVQVSANLSYHPGTADTQVQNFALQPHTLDQIFGPLLIDGGQIEDRSLKPGVHLPTEIDSPLPVLSSNVDESLSTDTLNIYEDGAVNNSTDGLLSTIDSTYASVLGGVYHVPTVDASAFGHL
ncbi:MAG: hypothetical protein ABUS54_10215, partial [Actinomycetota bacterium]